MTAVLNGANEIAVAAFLNNRIRFGGIAELVEETMLSVEKVDHPSLEQVFEADRKARLRAEELLNTKRFS